jgi:hypothetical protein
VLALVAVALLLAWLTASPCQIQKPNLGLFTSLPIWWAEAPDIAAQIAAPGQQPHWARAVLADRRRVVLLDTLFAPGGLADLLIAQPRPLAAQENVALDRWVRGGGHLLLFADPLLTWDSRFALGDRRRPLDTVLLSPILHHWGLDLQLGASGPPQIAPNGLPVNLPGELVAFPGGTSTCRIGQAGLMAECRIGAGRALIVADAALLEAEEQPALRARALRALLRRAFAR